MPIIKVTSAPVVVQRPAPATPRLQQLLRWHHAANQLLMRLEELCGCLPPETIQICQKFVNVIHICIKLYIYIYVCIYKYILGRLSAAKFRKVWGSQNWNTELGQLGWRWTFVNGWCWFKLACHYFFFGCERHFLGVSENSVPLNPMVLLIIIPIKWLFHWEYTLFSDKPF